MKKIRFIIRLFISLLARYKLLVIGGFLLGAIFFFSFPKIKNLLPEIKKTETIGYVGRFQVSEIPLEIQNLLSFGLTKIQSDGTPTAGIASRWVIEDDGKSYTFFLRDDLFWHDGSKVSSFDINYNFQDVSVEKPDSKTIRFRLKEPFSPFLEVVSRPVFKKGFLGLGAYKIQKITRSGQFVETISLLSREADKPNLKFRFYPTEQAAKIGFKLGEVQKLVNLLDKSGFENWKGVKTTAILSQDRFVGLFFNTQKPYLEKKQFRQALAYAVEKKKDPERAYGPLSPLSWAYNEDVKPYNFDLENAKKLLGKVLENNGGGKEISLKLLTGSSLLPEAERIKDSWKKIGINVEIGAFREIGEDFDVLLAVQEIPRDPDQYHLWHSTQPGNITNFWNPRIDKLLEDGRRISSLEERKKIYFDFQRFLVEEAPVVFLYYPTSYEISRN